MLRLRRNHAGWRPGNPLFQVIEDAPLYRVIELLQITQGAAIKFNRPGQERVSLLPD